MKFFFGTSNIAIIYFDYLEYKKDGDGVKLVEKIVKLAISTGLSIIVAAMIGAIVLKAATAFIGIGAIIGVLIGLINTRLNLMDFFSLISKLRSKESNLNDICLKHSIKKLKFHKF